MLPGNPGSAKSQTTSPAATMPRADSAAVAGESGRQGGKAL